MISVTGFTTHGTLSGSIRVTVDGEKHAKIRTSCAKPIGPGAAFGDFLVVGGQSRHGGPLCALDAEN